VTLWLNVLLLLALQILGDRWAGRAPEQQETAGEDSVRHVLLISDTTGMETAWTVPRDPSTQSLPADSALAAQIRHGFELFTKTSQKAPRFSASILSCSNCHLNAGQREKALPLVGVAGLFPEHNKRAGRAISLEERIIGCFLRSENATGVSGADTSRLPGVRSKEVEALAAYIHWISEPVSSAHPPSWRFLHWTGGADARCSVNGVQTAMGRMVRVCRSAIKGPDLSGARTPGTTGQAWHASIRSQGSSATQCRISLPEHSLTRKRRRSPRTSIRSRGQHFPSKIVTIPGKKSPRMQFTTIETINNPPGKTKKRGTRPR